MPPRLVRPRRVVDVEEGAPFRPLRPGQEGHPRLARGPVPLPAVAGHARADDVLPAGLPSPVAGNHVVEVEPRDVVPLAAILAGVAIPLEDIVPGELDLLAGQAVEEHQEDHLGNADLQADGPHPVILLRARSLEPLIEVEGLELLRSGRHHLGVALIEQNEGPLGRAEVDRLPKPIQHQHAAVQAGRHWKPSLIRDHPLRQSSAPAGTVLI